MFKLDEATTRTFVRLLDKLQNKYNLDIAVPDHPILRLERFGPFESEEGCGDALSLGQLFKSDPPLFEVRMIFLVVLETSVSIFPLSYHDDVNDVREIAVILFDGQVKSYNEAIQQSLAKYARDWLSELATAEYF